MSNSGAINISVIMPVYNSEAFIKRSLESLITQSFNSFEVLIIDDGSTDKTGDICDGYANADNRIRIFHKQNGGVASARQMGIEHAQGEYIIHFDADDFASSNMLSEMYSTALASNADIVIADFYEKLQNGTVRYVKQNFESSLSSDVLIDILERRLFGALWHKLIRKDLYTQKKISFLQNVNYCEDVLIEAKLLKDDDVKVVHHPFAYYCYCHDNKDSITVHYDESKLQMRITFLNELHKILTDSKFSHALEATIWDVKMEAFRHGQLRLRNFEKVYHSSVGFICHTDLSRNQRLLLMLSSTANSLMSCIKCVGT